MGVHATTTKDSWAGYIPEKKSVPEAKQTQYHNSIHDVDMNQRKDVYLGNVSAFCYSS